MLMSFNIGDWVEHALFGNGKIIEDRGTYFTIRFVTAGEKKLTKTFVQKEGAPPHPGFSFPETRRTGQSKSAAGMRTHGPAFSFDHLLERFSTHYPGGFDDPAFDADERQYKEAAVRNFAAKLSKAELQLLINAGEYSEIAKRAKQIASGKMNLIFPQELMKFNDSLKDALAQEEFGRGLFDVLYGLESEETLFERYVTVLGKIGCLKWTVATYFQFLATNGGAMFMKPLVSQVFAHAVGVDLNYSPEPTWLTYQKLGETAKIVRLRLEALGMIPRHGIDVQSFMYVAWYLTK
jgi:hypothetical protein